MENNEKSIDISETPIGNYGAQCVATVVPLIDGLEEIRLNNCSIGDDGAISLFSELESNTTVTALELSNNPMTEKAFTPLIKMLSVN